jgi:HIP---CoA ligase
VTTPWPTIPAMLRDTAERLGDAEAVVDGEARVDFATLRGLVDRAAGALLATGIERGDRVSIWAPNSLEWIAAALAVTTAGAVLVPVNTRFRGAEASYVLARSGARVLFTVRGFLDTDYPALLADSDVALPALEHTVLLAGATEGDDSEASGGERSVESTHRRDTASSWDDFVASGSAVTPDEIDVRIASIGPDDPSDVVYTSGTTGNPKGVVMTHGQTLRAYLDWCDWADLRPRDRYLIANPFFHIFGYKAGCLACLMRGATIFPVAVFDPGVVLEMVERERISVLPGPPTIYHALLDHPDRLRRDITSLRVGVTGAADIPVELIRRVREELPFERILTGYGLTEAGTVTGSRPDDDFEHIATTVGIPWPGFEVRVVNEAGTDAPVAEPGEVVVRGATVTRGYLDDPEATAAAIDRDGWLHTGDLGTLDADGYLRIVGRIKDMFIVGGFNAYPAEIENLMLRHPRVGQVAVIGVPDERLGEVAKAFVVLDPGPAIAPSEIVEWARGEMANFKAPRTVEFLDALPVNATGKVVKDELRARTVPEKERST